MDDDFGIDITSDTYFMSEALRQARKAGRAEETPIGAVIVFEGRVIARAHNQVETLKDATAHAEMLAISQSQAVLEDWRLNGCALYVTKEPCVMCSGAIVLARIPRVVFGACDAKRGGAGGRFNILRDAELNHRSEVVSGILEGECASLLRAFFRERRLMNKGASPRLEP